MNELKQLSLKHYAGRHNIIYEDCGCSSGAISTGITSSSSPMIQMNTKTKHIISPSAKSRLVTEALLFLSENEIIDSLIKPELTAKFMEKSPVATKLSKYNVKEAKELINDEFKNNPELPDRIVHQVNNLDESSILGDIKNNITQKYQNFKPTTTKSGNIVSSHNQLSKSGEANSMMGAKQVIKNTMNISNGSRANASLKTESAHMFEESNKLTYNDLTKRKPVITPSKKSIKQQPIETHYDKTIASPTHHLKSGEKILVANKLADVKGNLQADRDAIKKASSMQQSV